MQSTSQARTYQSAASGSAIALAEGVDLLARVALAAIFIWSGLDKVLLHTAGNVGYMQAYHVPLANILVYPAGLFELAGGLLILVGWQARAAALVLALFTVLVTPIFHNFWTVPADQALNQTIHFMKNIAIIGGLLHVAARGSGRLSIDKQ
jgi:putative oxidoreductase